MTKNGIQSNIRSFKIMFLKLISPLIIFNTSVFSIQMCLAQTKIPSDDVLLKLVEKENAETNRIAKMNIFRQIVVRCDSIVASNPRAELDIRDWGTDYFTSMLEEKSPVLVEAAIYSLPVHCSPSLYKNLISLFLDADATYMGYSTRIKSAIISHFRRAKCVEAVSFMTEELERSNDRSLEHSLLVAIRELGVSPVKDIVTNYENRMRSIVDNAEKKGENPLIYSQILINADFAKTLIKEQEGNIDEKE